MVSEGLDKKIRYCKVTMVSIDVYYTQYDGKKSAICLLVPWSRGGDVYAVGRKHRNVRVRPCTSTAIIQAPIQQ